MCLTDVVTAYLYGSLDHINYMKIPSLHGSNQFGHMWYNCLGEYLLNEGYKNDYIRPSIFIKRANSGFAIIIVQVDDLNIIRTSKEILKVVVHLKTEFEIKDLRKTKSCRDLQMKHLRDEIFIH